MAAYWGIATPNCSQIGANPPSLFEKRGQKNNKGLSIKLYNYASILHLSVLSRVPSMALHTCLRTFAPPVLVRRLPQVVASPFLDCVPDTAAIYGTAIETSQLQNGLTQSVLQITTRPFQR